MKTDNYQKRSLSNNFSTKPSYTSSENKKSIQNLDNNISYSQSDENENRNDFNNDNIYGEDEAPIANNYKKFIPNDSNYSENNYYNNNINKNKFSKFRSVNEELNYNNYNNQFNRGYSAQMVTQPRKTYTTFNSGKLQNNNYYQNYYNNNKRTYSSDKNFANNYNSSQNYRFDPVKKSNNMLISNYASKNSNTKVIKIKKMPRDDINSSLKNKYYGNNNNYRSINYENYSSSTLNQTAPNIPVQNYIKEAIRLQGTKIGNDSINYNYPNFNNNYSNNSNNNRMMEINRNENYNKNFDNFKGNNTFENNSLRKPYSSNSLNYQGYQRINSNNQPILRNQISNPIKQSPYGMNTLEREEDEGDMEDDDDRFYNLSSTFNYLNRTDNFENNRKQPKNFAEVLKQPQPVLRNNPEFSRKTIVKKLPPLSSTAQNLKMAPLRQKATDDNNNDINRPTMTPSENNTRFNDERNLPNYNYNKTPKITIRMIDSQGNPIEKNRMQSKGMIQNNNFKNNLPNNNMIQNEPYNARFNPQFPQRQAMNAANVNRNYMPQNLASNTFKNNNQQIPQKENNYNNNISNQNQNRMIPRYNQNNYNDNNYSNDYMNNQNQNQNQINPEYCYPDPVLPLKDNELEMETNREENVNDEDENSQNQNEINEEKDENDEKSKRDVNISYNDFDDSGWIKNYGGVTSPGKNEKGEQRINQDALVSITNINKVRDFNIFGILDGHGPDGQKISEFASEYIPSQITNHPEIKSLSDPEEIYLKLKDNNCQIITDAYLSCDEQLKNVEYDAYNSGCTCTLVIHIGNHIICSNVGDSKGIVAYDEQVGQDEELNYLETAELNLIYRPEVLEERNRILMSGGIVEKMKDEYGEPMGPYRVWARGKNFPGLALSRSIGDLLGKNIGVIPDPGILEYDLSESTKFIAICSDGVWVYLNDEIVKNYGKSFYLDNNASGFCHYIVNQSVSEWEKVGPNVDDISVVVIFF